MTTSYCDDLDALAADVLSRLETAVDGREGPWRTPMLATAGPEGPSARVVVIRSIDPRTRRLEIFTDARSAKVREIEADPRVALAFWDPTAQQQLRMSAVARSVGDREQIDSRWHAIGAIGQALYDGDPARFVVIEAVWTEWDWLWIGGKPHRRARFSWLRGVPEGRWIDP
ncbi:MAG: pyridoxamine 5'-phosphate oxidase family protein [Alphaproteobacteria bacterium]|nr:pyridoxamine 5'-phosphate oxidase family protein [Alphaproteobacteria bacterium]